MTPPSALWAKLSQDRESWHSLVDHSADVAAVLMALLDQPTVAARLARLGGLDELPVVMRWRLAALAFLHDIGKANRGFQARFDLAAPMVGHIDQLAWVFSPDAAVPGSGPTLERLYAVLGLGRMEAWFEGESALEWLAAALAHHGRPWRLANPPESAANWKLVGADDPVARLTPMRDALDCWFAPAFEAGPALPDRPALIHAFAGLLMLADWLGSDEARFPFANGEDPKRWQFAEREARAAMRDVGLDVATSRQAVQSTPASFEAAFGVARPHSIQSMVTMSDAPLVVLESETGSGKTEAALWRFRHLFERGAVDGLYFALPTRVAASQIHARVMRFRDRVFGPKGGPTVVLAVPGQVRADHVRGRPLPEFGFAWDDDPNGDRDPARWAAEHPKRFLAAQIAVGTIDQVLLGTVRTRHAHLRGSLLLRHLLVVDEVHASDRYMGDLLVELLRWHVAAGGHALLLSATLGAGLRSQLLGTPRLDAETAEVAPYPAMSWAEQGREHTVKISSEGPEKVVTLDPQPIQSDTAAVAFLAVEAAQAGAAVLIVRNTVGRAVETARAVEDLIGLGSPLLFRVGGVSTLHHGRFAAADRLLLDTAVEAALGRDRAGKGRVVVGTQTLEQSLDLDADLLLTDLCPVDVLLQRIGRLHRHTRARPPGFEAARTIVLVPADRHLESYAPRHGYGAGRAYPDRRMLALTRGLMIDYPVWTIPSMNRLLVERATHPERLDAAATEFATIDPAWTRHAQEVEGRDIGQRIAANYALLNRGKPFSCFTLAPDEHVSSRLGMLDRQVDLGDQVGPFGARSGLLRISSWLVGDDTPDAEVTDLRSADGMIHFTLGAARLRYDRHGLERNQP